ncbi:hypothetical protein BKA65DRAFT_585140 [Rhexocercosporidium sp. MPI-PUGE-AT-0058]|nr:hypothetical protein BKA65DRAFT_585140 [Rhexocercosporidium sp. MPI-PUGE-AT-0058]
MQFLLVAFLIVPVSLVLTHRHFVHRKSQYRPIPGPKGLPWLGPIHRLPFLGLWFKFKEWSDEYGPFYGVKLLGKQHIFICTEKIASELLTKRGSIYSGSPAVPTIVDSQSRLGTAEYMPLMSRNKKKSISKVLHPPPPPFHILRYHHQQLGLPLRRHDLPHYQPANIIWVRILSSDPKTFKIKGFNSIIRGSPDYAPELKNDAWRLLQAISPVGNLSNLFTPLLILPRCMSPWKKWEKQRHDKQ